MATKTTVTNRQLVLASVMLALLVSAVEATRVTTAMDGIGEELGGLTSVRGIFSA